MEKVKNPKKIIALVLFCFFAWLVLVNFLFPVAFYLKHGFNIFQSLGRYDLKLLYLALTREVLPPHTLMALRNSCIASAVLLTVIYLFSLRVKKVNLHGEARFANNSEIQKFKDANKGIIIGKHDGKLLRFDGQQFVLLGAPSRSGKGVAVVVPNLLDWEGSLIVLDIKKEAYSITSKYRQKVLKQEIFLFSPFSKGSSSYNPLDYVDFSGGLADLQLDAIASIIYASKSGDDFFTPQARKLFVGICLFVHDLIKNVEEFSDMPFSIGTALQFSVSVDGIPFAVAYEQAKKAGILSEGTILRIDAFLALSDNTASGVKGSFDAPLGLYASEIVRKNTDKSSFLLTDIRRKRMTIYIGLSPADLVQGGALINLFFSQLILENTKALPEQDTSLKHKCLLLMDEFASLGQIEIIKKGAAFIAGYNLRLLTVFQSMSQLEEHPPAGYGREGARSLTTNHACQIAFAPKEEQDAKEYSERLGYYGLDSQSKSRSSQGILNSSGSISESSQKRALMLPQEIKELPFEKQIIFIEAAKPMLVNKSFYYDDDYFIDKLRQVSPTLQKITKPTKDDFDKVFASGETTATVF